MQHKGVLPEATSLIVSLASPQLAAQAERYAAMEAQHAEAGLGSVKYNALGAGSRSDFKHCMRGPRKPLTPSELKRWSDDAVATFVAAGVRVHARACAPHICARTASSRMAAHPPQPAIAEKAEHLTDNLKWKRHTEVRSAKCFDASVCAHARQRDFNAVCAGAHLTYSCSRLARVQLDRKMQEATGGEWSSRAPEHVHAKSHALRESALYSEYAVYPVAAAPAPPRASAEENGGGASDDDDDAGAGGTAAGDAVAAELLKLFTAAKGLSRSVLLATEAQEEMGAIERQQAEWDPPEEEEEGDDEGGDAGAAAAQ